MSPPPDLDRLTSSQLKELVVRLLGEVAELKQTVAHQREEIARLKGLKGRPISSPAAWIKRKQPASYVWKSRPQPSILASPGVGLCSFRGRRVWLISGAMGGLHGAGSGMRRGKVTVIARRHRISER